MSGAWLAVLLFSGVFALSLLVNFALIRAPLLDRPNARSSHVVPTPKGGGIGVILAALAGTAAFLVLPDAGPDRAFVGLAGFWLIVGAGSALAVIALIDDIRPLRADLRLLAQVVAACAAMSGGALVERIEVPGLGALALNWLAWPLTLLWIVGLTNAVNFMDGLNGLVGGVTLVASIVMVLCAIMVFRADALEFPPALLFAALVPALLGFLVLNVRGRIFLGDVGSQFLGFIFAALAAYIGGASLLLWLSVLLFAPFLVDVCFTLVRRAIRGDRLTQAHRGHLYQVLNRSGWSHGRVALLLSAMTLAHGWAGLSVLADPDRFWPLLATLTAVHAAYFWLVVSSARRVALGRW